DYRFTDTPASINLQGRTATTVGVNLGAMWDINEKVTVGVSWRSKMNLTVKCGDASLRYANEIARNLLQDKLNVLDQANFKATMPAVSVLNFGVSYKPVKRLILAFDAQLSGWGAYKNLDIEFLSEQLAPYNQHLEKNYKNSWTLHLGAQYDITKRFQGRLGLMADFSPVNQNYYNPETPGMTKIEPSIGFSFSPVKYFAIDASLMYVAGLGKDNASCTYTDLLLNMDKTFTANYSTYSWCPSIGFRVNF
ncbi:MAG: outer membrane protein transport protein, partial [Muribaculaceae bacterium]|nr:outer membrane protein transport protein [Muribaculaceae bacterium]